jgi:hypothetical protein
MARTCPIRPDSLLGGTGKALRHVKLRARRDLSPAVAALLRVAIADRTRRSGL